MRIAINGFGRIGRAITRIALKNDDIDIVLINDVNPDINNVSYLLKYDSTYGKLEDKIFTSENKLIINDKKYINIYNKETISDIPWEEYKIDVLIDSSGVFYNRKLLPLLINRGVKHCIITNSPGKSIFKPIIIGANETSLSQKHQLISSSICDANAFVPVIQLLNNAFGVEHGFLTTLHPWLSYQNLLDGPSLSVSDPGNIYSTYVLGRSSINTLIPKTTSAIESAISVLPWLENKFMCLSYRVPTMIVSSADISVKVNKNVTTNDIIEVFKEAERLQKYQIIYNSNQPLTSIDFVGTSYSSIIDHRWTMVNAGQYCKIVLWYDNEWGYSSRVIDIINLLKQ